MYEKEEISLTVTEEQKYNLVCLDTMDVDEVNVTQVTHVNEATHTDEITESEGKENHSSGPKQ